VVVPIYPTLLSQQVGYILNDSQPVAIFCSDAEQVAKVEASRGDAPSLRNIISFDPVDRAITYTLEQVREIGEVQIKRHPTDADARSQSTRPDDLATIIYTSGTTADPKGVMLTHWNIVSNVVSVLQVLPISEADSCLSFLPLSHIFERMGGYYTMVSRGVSIAYAESIDTVANDLGEIRPTILVSVPRLYEKMYSRVLNMATAGGPAKRGIFFWAKGNGATYATRKVAGQSIGPGLALKMKIGHALVFKKLQKRTGGRLRFFVSGGAPLAKEIAEFFFSAGLTILEGYGLTETSPVLSLNTLERFRPGSVGPPIPGTEVKIAEDGEILARGDGIMSGYYKKPDATAEAIVDGWFHTGDIGHIDEDGFLYITDRKKDLIVTAGGKNVAPQPLEGELKLSRYVTEVCLVGDQRKYIVALIVPTFESLEEYARRNGITFGDVKELLRNPDIQSLFQHLVNKINGERPSYEQVKFFRLLPEELTLENGELTPSLKVKRRVIQQKYGDIIEEMYQE